MNEHAFDERVRYVAYLGAIAADLKENYQYDLLELFTENPQQARRSLTLPLKVMSQSQFVQRKSTLRSLKNRFETD